MALMSSYDDVARRDGGDLGVVVGGRDLDDVGADDAQVGEGAQHPEQFTAREAAGLGGAGAGRVRGVEHVDVDRDVERRVADAGADALDRRRRGRAPR